MTLPTSGLHPGINEAQYHADPASISSTGLKTILTRGPRAYRWLKDHPPTSDAMDLGSVVHALILGVGDYEVLEFDSWRTKAAQAARDEARAAGRTPMLERDMREAHDIAEAVMSNRLAAAVLSDGTPEVSLWATDPATDVLMRGRIDYLSSRAVVDLKTSRDLVDPRTWERTAWKSRYDFQAAAYLHLLELNGEPARPYLWVAVSKTAPSECYVHEPSAELLSRGAEDLRRALETYRRCLDSDTWPGLADDQEIHQTELPRWER